MIYCLPVENLGKKKRMWFNFLRDRNETGEKKNGNENKPKFFRFGFIK